MKSKKKLSFTKKQVKAAYKKFDKELKNSPPRKRNKDGLSSTQIMSQRLFDQEDSDDSDLI